VDGFERAFRGGWWLDKSVKDRDEPCRCATAARYP